MTLTKTEKNNRIPLFETAALAVGEIVVSLIVTLVFVIIRKFTPSVIFGALLGSAVVVLNFIWLSVSVNRAVDRALECRPDGELDDDAVEKFSDEHTAAIQNAVKLSYITRTATTLVTLVVAFLFGKVFNVIATLVPLLMLQPILTATELIKRRLNR